MARLTEAEIEDLKARNPCDQVAGQWVTLRRSGRKMVGPCPICSPDPTSRTATRFEVTAEGWVCAVCADGGDQIRLVMKRENIEFGDAIERLGGTRAIDPEEAARAEKFRAEQRAKRDAEANQFRERERRRLWEMWSRGIVDGRGNVVSPARPIAGTAAAEYLARRGIALPVSSARLRYIAKCPMYADGSRGAAPVHTGPAMLAAIVANGGAFAGLHITWLDLDQAKGKAVIKDPASGEILPAKKVRGSKAGGHIELISRSAPQRLVIGEGIETVGSVGQDESSAELFADTAYWSAVDLGNLGGRAAETVNHPTLKTANNRAQRVPGPAPDLAAPAIEIPESVEEIILLGDSDSDRFLTECTLARAAARYARPGRTVKAAWAPAAIDFNNVLQDQPAGSVAAIVAAAAEIEPIVIPQNPKKSARVARAESSSPSLAGDAAAANSQAPADHEGVAEDPPLDAAAAAPPPPAAADFPAEKGPSSQMGANDKKTDGRLGAGRAAARRRGSTREDLSAEDPKDLDLRLAFFPMTDLGNAERFRERHRGRLLWCAAVGWLHWDGRRWSRKGADERVKRAAHETVRSIMDEADALAASDKDLLMSTKTKGKGDDAEVEEIHLSDILRRWARASEDNGRLNQLAKQADAYLAIATDRLDADPFKINCQNYTLTVRKTTAGSPFIEYADHDPADLITKIAPIDFDPAAECPKYDQFLVDVQPKPEMRRFLHQWLGLSLTGDVSEQRLCVWWGKGKNGKSVLMDTASHIAGDYSETVPIETFLAEGRGRNGGQATPDLAILPGVRQLRTSEPKRNATLDEALIKLATGGEPLQVRHLNRDYFKFYPQFKLTISGNYRPKIEGSDEGIWRRVILVPWTETITEEKRDLRLFAKLKIEGSGILNRLLDGLCDWLDNGLKLPQDVDEATADYRSDSDPLGRFLEACTVREPGARVQATAMHELFVAWGKANSATEWSPRGLAFALKERGLHSTKSSVSFWLDIKLTRQVRDFVDSHGKPITQPQAGAAAATGDPGPSSPDDYNGQPIDRDDEAIE